jgi:uncharacterized protein YbjT (DUF2867 family)
MNQAFAMSVFSGWRDDRRVVNRDTPPTNRVRTAATAKEKIEALIHGRALNPIACASSPQAAAHQPT